MRTLVYRLDATPRGWRIADIRGSGWTLLGILKSKP
jgi:hypothetical protein